MRRASPTATPACVHGILFYHDHAHATTHHKSSASFQSYLESIGCKTFDKQVLQKNSAGLTSKGRSKSNSRWAPDMTGWAKDRDSHLSRPSQEAPEGEGHQCAAHEAANGAFHSLLWADADELRAPQGLAKGVRSSVSRNCACHRHEGGNEAHCPVRDTSKEHLSMAALHERLTAQCPANFEDAKEAIRSEMLSRSIQETTFPNPRLISARVAPAIRAVLCC